MLVARDDLINGFLDFRFDDAVAKPVKFTADRIEMETLSPSAEHYVMPLTVLRPHRALPEGHAT